MSLTFHVKQFNLSSSSQGLPLGFLQYYKPWQHCFRGGLLNMVGIKHYGVIT